MADRRALVVLGGLLVFASCFSVMAAVEDRAAFPQPATAYDFSKLRREKLRRGVVAFRSGEREAVVTWRYRLQDPTNLAFNVYRDGVRLNSCPLTGATFYKDASFDPAKGGLYSVRPVLGRRESQNPARGWRIPPSAPIGYIPLKVAPPPPWRNPDEPEHAPYPYLANDCTIGDLDGDGEFELAVKWNAVGRDNAHFGRTAPVFYDGYDLLAQRRLWRLTPGKNVRSGPHYDDFLVFDLDGDMTRSWLCGNRIGGYSASKGRTFVIRELEGGCSNNGSKDNPCFSGDLLGDWREEVILRNAQDPTELRLYVSDIPTEYRFWTFLQDPVYRISLATEPAGYNQPPQPGFYFGRDLLRRKTFFRGEKIP